MGIVYKYDAVFGLTLTFDEIVALVPVLENGFMKAVNQNKKSVIVRHYKKVLLAHKAERKSPNF